MTENHRDTNELTTDDLVGDWLTLREAAKLTGVSPNRIKQFIGERKLLGVVRKGELCVPAVFLEGGDVIKGLQGTLTLLHDSGFSTDEALRWLFTPDPTLPGTPAAALAADRGTEIRRRAQAMAF